MWPVPPPDLEVMKELAKENKENIHKRNKTKMLKWKWREAEGTRIAINLTHFQLLWESVFKVA